MIVSLHYSDASGCRKEEIRIIRAAWLVANRIYRRPQPPSYDLRVADDRRIAAGGSGRCIDVCGHSL